MLTLAAIQRWLPTSELCCLLTNLIEPVLRGICPVRTVLLGHSSLSKLLDYTNMLCKRGISIHVKLAPQ